ncbi:MAG: sulfurtransferase TusA family protein [Hyphomicrobiales bacterium]|nr:sulfurtransferase TusA family protein [Hyphomicrobiales bacterium]
MADRHLDATGLTCPLPVLKLRKLMKDMQAGQTVEMLATDPGALDDVPHFCASSGCDLLETTSDDTNIHRFVIRKGDL